MRREPCPDCSGFVSLGGKPLSLHLGHCGRRRKLADEAEYRRIDAERSARLRSPEVLLAAFERDYLLLAADVAECGLHAPSRHDWPNHDGIVTQEVDIGEQVHSLYRRVAR
jgi:hypothetical protein